MRARVPAMASTKRRVSVATPERRWIKLSATRSAVSSEPALPFIVSTVSPGTTEPRRRAVRW